MNCRLSKCAAAVLENCAALRRGESVVVVSDQKGYEVGRAFWDAASEMCKEAVMVLMSQGRGSSWPVGLLKFWFSRFDVAIINAQTHIDISEMQTACSDLNVRIIGMRFTDAMSFTRIMGADWKRHGLFTRRCAALLGAASRIRVKDSEGTDILFRNSGKSPGGRYGEITRQRTAGTLPAGSVGIIPLKESVQGTIAMDATCGKIVGECAAAEIPLLTVNEGVITRLQRSGGEKEFEKLLGKRGHFRTICGFGAGTLQTATAGGCLHEALLARGAVHFKFKNSFAENDPVIIHAIIQQPSVWLDDRLWIDKGKYV